MRALLVHGMGRTPASMYWLARTLRREGVQAELFGYSAAFESVEQIVSRLRARLEVTATADYAVVGHSLGGLLLRAALAGMPEGTPSPTLLVMLGTPHRSPRLARRFNGAFWFRAINGDAGRMLASPERMAAIPPPTAPSLVVAGTRGPRGRWSPFGDEVNDGLVALEEARLGEEVELVELPILHPFMTWHPDVRRLIVERLVAPRS